MKREVRKDIPRQQMVIITDPFGPIFLPNKPAVIELIKGKNSKFKYI